MSHNEFLIVVPNAFLSKKSVAEKQKILPIKVKFSSRHLRGKSFRFVGFGRVTQLFHFLLN